MSYICKDALMKEHEYLLETMSKAELDPCTPEYEQTLNRLIEVNKMIVEWEKLEYDSIFKAKDLDNKSKEIVEKAEENRVAANSAIAQTAIRLVGLITGGWITLKCYGLDDDNIISKTVLQIGERFTKLI